MPDPQTGNDHQQGSGKNNERCDRPAQFFNLGDNISLFVGHRLRRRVEKDLILLPIFEHAPINQHEVQDRRIGAPSNKRGNNAL